jgi:drug/metabolite transporter (DMT)-like permease
MSEIVNGNDSTRRGLWAIIACALLWSIGGLLIKWVNLHPLAVAGARSLIAALFLLFVLKKPKITRNPAQWLAALCNAATMILFVSANKHTTSANAILLQYGAPIFAAILGWLILKERPFWEHWAALVAVLAGMALFFMNQLGPGNLAGDIMAVSSGLTFALFFVFMRMQKEGSPLESFFLSHLITAAVGLPFLFMGGLPDARGALALTGLGVFQIGVASLLFTYGIKRVTALQSMLAAVIEPLMNPVWVLLFTGERPAVNALIGGSVILAAVALSNWVTINRSRRLACT